MRLLLALLLAAAAAPLTAQDSVRAVPKRTPFGAVRPLLEGALAGVVVASAYTAPSGTGWLMRDENAARAAVLGGAGAALLAWATSGVLRPDAPDRPRLRLAVGAASEAEYDASLALRVPLRRRLAVEGGFLVRNESLQQSRQETRCSSILGCTTGTYLVHERYEQSVGWLARAAYEVPAGGALRVVLTVGGGRLATHLEATDRPPVRRDDTIAEAGVGLEHGRVARWTAEAVVRGAVPTGRELGTRGPEVAVRLGRAFGYR